MIDKYKMRSELVTTKDIDYVFTRLVVYCNNKQIHTEDLFSNNMYENYKVYEDIVKQHKRERKINQLLK